MITLHDIFIDLSGGEFSNLKLGAFALGDPDSEPDPRTYLQLIRHVNLALTAIYTEFFLRSDECYIQLQEDVAIYKIDYRHAQSNVAGTEPNKYIMDTVENPFPDNHLKTEEVYNEVGEKLFLNDPDEDLSIYTPAYNTIQVPWPNDFNTIAVMYRADHPTVVYTPNMDASSVFLELPRQLREALLFYVAARVFAGITTEKPEANAYFQKYVAEVQKVHRLGLQITTDQDNNRFAENGWC
jgi:hypothetical protein